MLITSAKSWSSILYLYLRKQLWNANVVAVLKTTVPGPLWVLWRGPDTFPLFLQALDSLKAKPRTANKSYCFANMVNCQMHRKNLNIVLAKVCFLTHIFFKNRKRKLGQFQGSFKKLLNDLCVCVKIPALSLKCSPSCLRRNKNRYVTPKGHSPAIPQPRYASGISRTVQKNQTLPHPRHLHYSRGGSMYRQEGNQQHKQGYVVIKGTVSRDGYIFWRPKHFNQYFLCIRWLTFYLFLWNYLLIFKMLTETLLRISFSAIGRCSTLQRKSHLCIPFLRIARPQSQYPH